MAQENPLSDRPASERTPVDAMHRHAQIWQHVQGMKGDDVDVKIGQLDHILPVLGALAHNPNTTSKDVIKAAANAAAKRVITPTDAVKFITMIPPKNDDLLPWLRDLYTADLSMAVHLKAANMAQAQQPEQQAAMPPQMPAQPMSRPPAPQPMAASPLAAQGAPNPLAGGPMP